jgi:hypothetical protein
LGILGRSDERLAPGFLSIADLRIDGIARIVGGRTRKGQAVLFIFFVVLFVLLFVLFC